MTQICGEPCRSLTKAMREPSGDQVGEVSMNGVLVSRFKMLPVVRQQVDLASCRPATACTASLLPSGEKAAPMLSPGRAEIEARLAARRRHDIEVGLAGHERGEGHLRRPTATTTAGCSASACVSACTPAPSQSMAKMSRRLRPLSPANAILRGEEAVLARVVLDHVVGELVRQLRAPAPSARGSPWTAPACRPWRPRTGGTRTSPRCRRRWRAP